MSQHCNWGSIIEEAFDQIGSEGIRTPAEFAIGQPLISTDVRDRAWSYQSPVIDLFDEIHLKTLVNKWRRRKVATTVHRD